MLEKLLKQNHMAMVSYILIMMIFYKAFLSMVDVKARAGLLKLMEAIIKEILKIMWLMVMESMWAKKGLDIKGNGKIMCPMVQGKLLILMAQGMLVNF